jgi:polyhydroxyalkanoate synthesis regulator phasin
MSKVEQVMARIRGEAADGPGGEPAAGRRGRLFPDDVYRCLHQARTLAGGLVVDYALGWRTPILGPVWMRVRQRIHQEIRIYIDALIAQQSHLNTQLIRAVSRITETLDGLGLPALRETQRQQAAEIAALRAEVERLRQRLEALEARDRPGTASGPDNQPS